MKQVSWFSFYLYESYVAHPVQQQELQLPSTGTALPAVDGKKPGASCGQQSRCGTRLSDASDLSVHSCTTVPKNLTKGRTARVCLHLVCVVRVLCGFS